MKAVLKQTRISPKKANLVAGMIRGKKVADALEMLKLMPKKGAQILYKVLHSAVYNAKNNFNQSEEDLIVKKVIVGKGPTYKRSLPISRGRAHPILKRTSHITMEVAVAEESVKSSAKKSVSKKENVSTVQNEKTNTNGKAKKTTVKKETSIKKAKEKKNNKK